MHFTDKPSGLPGNDDYGAMSSWLLFTSIGLFPHVGTTRYYIYSPSVSYATIKLIQADNMDIIKLSIKAYNNTDQNVFVDKLLINGKEHTLPYIEYNELMIHSNSKDGIILEFFMSNIEKSQLCLK